MIVQMDKTPVLTSWERAQLLYDKNVELENKRRKSAQAKIPSDPNAWYQMRENYEAIVLENHAFSEQHNIEFALWQLHYKRIEEFRAHLSAAQASGRTSNLNGGIGPAQPDRIMKIRVQFKAFLSEATGFYHDLILKIRAKYSLPLWHFSEDSDNHIIPGRGGAKTSEAKKGLVSFHRCLIYLGDLARYKGLYGEGESRNRDYTASSSYYLQAAASWPSSGNPHHQLAILASYSGDELVVVYRYFRSLAAEIPCTTAKDNLLVAFEKNFQNYNQLQGKFKAAQAKDSGRQMAAKENGDKEFKFQARDVDRYSGVLSERSASGKEKYREFCIQFVHLSGIIFTRTSLEAFSEVLSSVRSALYVLLSFGQEEEHSFVTDTLESGLAILRLIAILIFTVYNVSKKSEAQTYAGIIQRTVLLQNAFTATFELIGLMIDRCLQLRDPSSSFLLPGILVFLEWFACYPDIAACNDVEGKPAAAKLLFWKQCIAFFNKLLSNGSVSVDDDEDETCFTETTKYKEVLSGSRGALLEDFELRGFLPLLPAQMVLDFSRKCSLGVVGSNKEKKTRIKRILAAGKSMVKVITIDQKPVHFDSKVKQFVVGIEPEMSSNTIHSSHRGAPESCIAERDFSKGKLNSVAMQVEAQFVYEGEEEDEEIVFKPTLTDKQMDATVSEWAHHESPDVFCLPTSSDARSKLAVPAHINDPLHHRVMETRNVPWLVDQKNSLSNGLRSLSFMENGHVMKPNMQEGLGISDADINGALYSGHRRAVQVGLPSIAAGFPYSNMNAVDATVKKAATTSAAIKSQAIRPVRHHGPPPGFSPVPSKQLNIPVLSSDGRNESLLMDDYSWLIGSQLSSMTHNSGNISAGITSFPFPGKQVSDHKSDGYRNYQPFENPNLNYDHKLPEQRHNVMGNQQFTAHPEHYPRQTTSTARHLV
ncbi:hypothetical protein Nepgr_014876 [Nepenthes gracilis]|uniref:Protein SMG7 n=1 Tax=Nepenthes gracilis TaxID=150966 RepID=A0AAD3XQX0_NEPGR|nr:hypothetical protein Nepgr_014876 [Nepenthes gracilis]